MAKSQTRLSNVERQRLMARGYVRSSVSVSLNPRQGDEAIASLRKVGRKACSQLDAVMSRRRELGLV